MDKMKHFFKKQALNKRIAFNRYNFITVGLVPKQESKMEKERKIWTDSNHERHGHWTVRYGTWKTRDILTGTATGHVCLFSFVSNSLAV